MTGWEFFLVLFGSIVSAGLAYKKGLVDGVRYAADQMTNEDNEKSFKFIEYTWTRRRFLDVKKVEKSS